MLGLSFDETNGSVAYDSTGNANHANLLNPGQWSAGKSGAGISFDGDNDGVFSKVGFMNQPSAHSRFRFGLNGTVICPGLRPIMGSAAFCLLKALAFFNDNFRGWQLGVELEVYLDSGNGSKMPHTSSGAGISDGTWHHLGVTYGTGLKLYLDGNLVLDRPEFTGPLDSSQDSPLSLGIARVFSDQWGDFNGSMDDLRLFDRELNASEVGSLYGGGNGDYSSVYTRSESGRVRAWVDLSERGETPKLHSRLRPNMNSTR